MLAGHELVSTFLLLWLYDLGHGFDRCLRLGDGGAGLAPALLEGHVRGGGTEETDDALVEVRVAEVVGGDPEVEGVRDELGHDGLALSEERAALLAALGLLGGSGVGALLLDFAAGDLGLERKAARLGAEVD